MSVLLTPENPLFGASTPVPAGEAGAAYRTLQNANITTAEDKARSAVAYHELLLNNFGFGGLSGGEISVGTGLTANIALGSALIGNYVSWAAIVSPALTQSTTNYIWMRQDGTASATVTTTAPSGDGKGWALLWGTATTNTTVVTAVTNDRRIFQLQSSRLSKSVAGAANVTLTTLEMVNPIMEFTGVLTGNIELRVKLFDGWQAIVFNNTTGAFSLTVKGATGTGIVVATAKTALLYSDGVNVYRATADV